MSQGDADITATDLVPQRSEAPADRPADPLDQPIFAPPENPRGRFRLAYAALAGVLAAAVVAFVVLVLDGRPAQTQWSTFKPTAVGVAGAEQIAEHVASHYAFDDGSPLVDVLASPLSLQDEPVNFIALRKSDINGRNDPLLLPDQNAIEYSLCGDASQKCAITKGDPSPERFRLLSRAGFELALYTFRYLDDVDSVVAFLPPRAGDDPQWALFFQRGELAEYLEEPLTRTLADGTLTVSKFPESEVARIDRLTQSHRFQYQFQQAEEGTPLLLLDEVPDQG